MLNLTIKGESLLAFSGSGAGALVAADLPRPAPCPRPRTRRRRRIREKKKCIIRGTTKLSRATVKAKKPSLLLDSAPNIQHLLKLGMIPLPPTIVGKIVRSVSFDGLAESPTLRKQQVNDGRQKVTANANGKGRKASYTRCVRLGGGG